MPVPSMALTEIVLLAIAAGLLLLVGGIVLAIVIGRKRGGSAQANSQPGPDAATSRLSNPGKWLLLLGLAVLLALPLLPLVVVASGILIVTPVKSTRTDHQGPAPQVQVVAMPTAMGASLAATPTNTPWPTSKPGAGPIEAPPPEPASQAITPDYDLLFVALPGIAGLAVLVGVMVIAVFLARWREGDAWSKKVSETSGGKGSRFAVALVALPALAILGVFAVLALDFSRDTFIWSVMIFAACLILVGLLLIVPRLVRRWRGKDIQPRDQGMGHDNGEEWAGTARLRYALLALAMWFALSILLVLDVGFSVSVYWKFIAIYVAFWVLVSALLLVGSPRREKLLILGLVIVALFSIRFVDWNSRKPFLKDLYRVREGMTVEQVEQIMGNYMGGTGWPACPLGLPAGTSAAEPEELALPDRLVYRHTDEGWGNSDWGEIRFEEGRVVEIRFLPD